MITDDKIFRVINYEMKTFRKQEWSYAIIGLTRTTGMKVMQDVRVEFTDRIATIGNELNPLTIMH